MSSESVEIPHKDYRSSIGNVHKMRDSIAGTPALKSQQNCRKYLPYPNPDAEGTDSGDEEYARYLARAEYDNAVSATLEALCGAVFRKGSDFERLDESLKYLIEDADGDGLSLEECIKISVYECLTMRYIGLMAEFSDLSNLDVDNITVSDANNLNLRGSIKQYNRESIINWQFRRINGKKQLTMVVLKEIEEVRKTDIFVNDVIVSYLVLQLDSEGYYFQKKYVAPSTSTQAGGWSEEYYPTDAEGNYFDYIPFVFAIADERVKGDIPTQLGYVYPIAEKAISRYQVSADMKEALWHSGAPTTYSTGWTESGFSLFKQMTGKNYIVTGPGAHVPIPNESTMGMLNWQADKSAFFTYFKKNAEEIRALGGVFDTESTGVDRETATAAAIRVAEKSGALTSLVMNVEQAYTKVIGFISQYEGAGEGSTITINKEFASVKIDPAIRSAILAEYSAGLISHREALRQLHRGGVLTEDAEKILLEAQKQAEQRTNRPEPGSGLTNQEDE